MKDQPNVPETETEQNLQNSSQVYSSNSDEQKVNIIENSFSIQT